MIRIEDFMQLKAFARQDGALLGLLWIASFAALIFIPQSSLSNILILITPVLVGWRLIKFRNYALNGIISFRRAYAYCCYSFFYASLIFAVIQWAYFRFLDHGMFFQMLSNTLSTLTPIYQRNGMNISELNQSLNTIGKLNAIELSFMIMMGNMLIGLFLSLGIAVIGKIGEKK
jgi:hypothetical protein